MKEFETAELEIIEFDEDVVTASLVCMGQSCMCDGQQVCTQVT